MRIFLTIIILSLSLGVQAHKYDLLCGGAKRNTGAMARTTVADTGELAYDIKHVGFNLNLTNTATSVSGNVITTAVVTALSMDTYVFELNDTLTIDSFKLNGVIKTVSTTHPSLRKVALATPLASGSVFTAQVFYHGTGPVGTGFFSHGMTQGVSSGGTPVMYTCGDPNWCSDWWPCKQVLGDKIDSVDMIVTVPAGLKAPSNGVLLSTTTVSGGVQYHWKTRYPIDYYLVAVAVAPYVQFDSYIHFTPGTDSMPMQNFFYDTATFVPLYKKNFDSAALVVDYFSQLFGRYPFDKEKFGYCLSTLSGGMENQTMVTIGPPTTTVIAHELGHQWWGDHVTYASWRDIWLSEGFASYTEQLFVEHFWGKAAMNNYRAGRNSAVVSVPNGSLYVYDTSDVFRIFDGRLTYYKGAAVAHMLRYVAPSDAIYFQMLRTYQNTYAYGLATTENLKAIAAAAYGRNMDTFFNQWVYKQGYPAYKIKWNQKDNIVFVQLTQIPSDTSVSLFYTPIELQLTAGSNDTTIRVYNDMPVQLFSFYWDRTMTAVKMDPDNNILHKLSIFDVKHDATLGIPTVEKTNVQVFPNPAKEQWSITGVPGGTNMALTDINGHVLWRHTSDGKEIIIPANSIDTGNYILNLSGALNTTIKLTHR